MNISSIIKPLITTDPFQQINFKSLPIEESFLSNCEKFFGIKKEALGQEFTYENVSYKIAGHTKGCSTAIILEVDRQEGFAAASITSVLFMLYKVAPELLVDKMPNKILKYACLAEDFIEESIKNPEPVFKLLQDFFGKENVSSDFDISDFDLSVIPHINTTFSNYKFAIN